MSVTENITDAMIRNEMLEHPGARFLISNDYKISPDKLFVGADETLFVTLISIRANTSFVLDFYSGTESRQIEILTNEAKTIDYNIVTRHKGSIYFNMSNSDTYVVTYTRLKIIKK